MEFTSDPTEAMTWPSLAAAGRALDQSFAFGALHTLLFFKIDAQGRLGRGRSWAVGVSHEAKPLGFLRRYIVRGGEARFE